MVNKPSVFKPLKLYCICFPEGPKGPAGAGEGASSSENELSPSRLDLRVGKILTVEKVDI